MQRDETAILQAPAKPRGGKAKSRRRRKTLDLVARDMRAEQGSRAIKERIARAQHADGRAASCNNGRNGVRERRRPNHGFAGEGSCDRKMAGATHNQLGLRERFARGRRERLGAVLAEADEREPILATGRGHYAARRDGGSRCAYWCLAGRPGRASSRIS